MVFILYKLVIGGSSKIYLNLCELEFILLIELIECILFDEINELILSVVILLIGSYITVLKFNNGNRNLAKISSITSHFGN